jgi:hypothetical protein
MIDSNNYTFFDARKESIVTPHLKVLIAIFIIGAFFNSGFTVFSIAFIVILLGLLSLQTGVETDIINSRYRDYSRVFFIYTGKWKPLAEAEAILISKKPIRAWGALPGMSVSIKNNSIKYMIDLITKGDRDVLIATSMNKDEAYQMAKDISAEMKIKLYENGADGTIEIK